MVQCGHQKSHENQIDFLIQPESEEKISMKSLGIVRKVDELGRIVLPIETRKRLELAAGDGVEIFVEKDRVILKKYEPSCIFCGDADNVINYKDKKICKSCMEELKKSEI